MFNISKLILNSLYRFLCFVGLLSAAFFIAVPEFLEFSLHTKKVESLTFKAESLKSMQELNHTLKNHHQELRLYNALLDSDLHIENPIEKQKVMIKIIEANGKLASSYESTDYKNDLADIKQVEAAYYERKLEYLSKMRFWGVIVSLGVFFIGLAGWFFQIQRPLDAAFKNDPSKFVESNV